MLHGDFTRLTSRCWQFFLGQLLRQLRLDLHHRLAPHHRLGADALFQHRVAPRMQGAEAEVLQLGLDQVHAQALGDRRVDLQRFGRDAAARVHALRAERAHVVQAVGELDQDHAQVARHRQQHLAEAFRVGFLAVAELQLVQLGDAVDQFGHGRAELGGDRLGRERRVLEGVVQDRRDQGFDVQPLVGQHPATATGWVM